jgi:hypothetical protein
MESTVIFHFNVPYIYELSPKVCITEANFIINLMGYSHMKMYVDNNVFDLIILR